MILQKEKINIYTRSKLVKEYNEIEKKIETECSKPDSLERWINGNNTVKQLVKRKKEINKILGYED